MSKLRLCIAAGFAVIAFGAIAASTAQAGWLVLGTAVSAPTSIGASVTDKTGVLTFSSIEVECTKTALGGGTINPPAKILVSALEFSGCKVLKPTTCTLEGTSIATRPVEGEATLDGSLAFKTKIKPETGSLLATFKLNGASCASAGKNAVTGSFTALSPEGQDERLLHLVTLLVATAGELEVGSAAATISGSSLFCVEKDMTWRFT